jgi:hypothetical protein
LTDQTLTGRVLDDVLAQPVALHGAGHDLVVVVDPVQLTAVLGDHADRQRVDGAAVLDELGVIPDAQRLAPVQQRRRVVLDGDSRDDPPGKVPELAQAIRVVAVLLRRVGGVGDRHHAASSS